MARIARTAVIAFATFVGALGIVVGLVSPPEPAAARLALHASR